MNEADRVLGFIEAINLIDLELKPLLINAMMIGPLNKVEERINQTIKNFCDEKARDAKNYVKDKLVPI